ncbi:MAG: hypothetical protein Q7T11_03940 [Deltaproteobacteria bacterium]|nr:hypothetical protein [Deltaproteobacteria bacterium]
MAKKISTLIMMGLFIAMAMPAMALDWSFFANFNKNKKDKVVFRPSPGRPPKPCPTAGGPVGRGGWGRSELRFNDCDRDGYNSVEQGGIDCNDKDPEIYPGVTRESYSGPEGTAGVGLCQTSVEECVEGSWVVTQAEILPQEENTCNLIDEDCNGQDQEWSVEQVSLMLDGSDADNHVRGDEDYDRTDGLGFFNPQISADGRYVAYQSEQSMGSADTDIDSSSSEYYRADVYLFDRHDGSLELISVDTDWTKGNEASYLRGMSQDARFVLFMSYATNLAVDDRDDYYQWGEGALYIRDLQNNTTRMVKGGIHDAENFPVISGDGHYVSFSSSENLVGEESGSNVYLYDTESEGFEQVSVGLVPDEDMSCGLRTAISDTGRFIAFHCSNNLTGFPEPETPHRNALYIRDRESSSTSLVHVETSENSFYLGLMSNNIAMSGDGNVIAFASHSDDLVAGDDNGKGDLFLYDRTTGVFDKITNGLGEDYTETPELDLYPSLSTNGQYVSFVSWASNLAADDTNGNPDAFVYNREDHSIKRVSFDREGEELSRGIMGDTVMSADGTSIAFTPWAWPYDADLFVADIVCPE